MKEKYLNYYYSNKDLYSFFTVLHADEIFDLALMIEKKDIGYIEACQYLEEKFYDIKSSVKLLDYAIICTARLN